MAKCRALDSPNSEAENEARTIMPRIAGSQSCGKRSCGFEPTLDGYGYGYGGRVHLGNSVIGLTTRARFAASVSPNMADLLCHISHTRTLFSIVFVIDIMFEPRISTHLHHGTRLGLLCQADWHWEVKILTITRRPCWIYLT